MPKMDYKKVLSELYQASAKEVREVLVPPLSYLMIDGSGDPNTAPEYAQAVEALFSVSYTAKFALKKSNPELDYAVMPLEGLWWADDFSVFQSGDRQQWQWTMMILQPPLIDAEKIESAINAVRSKKSLPTLEKLRFQQFTEGRCAQTLHIGPFTEEGPTLQRVHDYIETRSTKRGKHHEIYLSDVRRADPQKWKTILRQPME
jgi:hypothetical protein